MKSFLIGGSIIDDSAQAWAFEDVTPSQVRSFLAKLEPGEDVTFEISSPGGSVTAGVAIANLIKDASKTRKCKAHIVGIAASMASVIACACDEIDIDESAFFMIHNPWTMTEGDADDLRKSADILDKMKAAILSFYRSKFDRTDDELSAMMDEETWITGASVADFGFKANVITTDAPLKAAACARHLPSFAKIPQSAEHLFFVATEADGSEPSDATATPAESTPAEAAPAEAAPAEAAPAEAAPAEAKPAANDFDARLAAAMRSRDTEINALKAKLVDLELRAVDVAAKIENDFQFKLDAKDKELKEAQASITSLTKALETVKGELQDTASALATSKSALATLNASVNTPAAVNTRSVNARRHLASLPERMRAEFYRMHREAVDNDLTVNI